MSDHPAREKLELYVIDGLDAAGSAAVAAHVRDCPACAAALAREARLELALAELAQTTREESAQTAHANSAQRARAESANANAMAARRLARQRAARQVRRTTGFLAVAAAALAIWIAARRAPAVASPPVLVTCLEAADEPACAAAARSAGLVVQFPAGAAARFDRADEDSAGPMDSNRGE